MSGREFRGAKLLSAIKKSGANQTAWSFFEEEMNAPDLIRSRKDTRTIQEEQLRRQDDRAIEARRLARAGIAKPKPAEALPSADTAPDLGIQAVRLLTRLKGDRVRGIARESLVSLMSEIKLVISDLDAKKAYSGRITKALDGLNAANEMDIEMLIEEALQYIAGEASGFELDRMLEEIYGEGE